MFVLSRDKARETVSSAICFKLTELITAVNNEKKF